MISNKLNNNDNKWKNEKNQPQCCTQRTMLWHGFLFTSSYCARFFSLLLKMESVRVRAHV